MSHLRLLPLLPTAFIACGNSQAVYEELSRSSGTSSSSDGRTADTGPKRDAGKDTGTPTGDGGTDAGRDGGHVGFRETGTKDTGARDAGARDTGAKDTGARDSGDGGSGAFATDVLTQRVNNARSGIFSGEKFLTQANVNAATFGKLFSIPVDGEIYAQPLYVTSLEVAGQTHNVLIVATTNNSVFAFDADTGAQIWHDDLGVPIFHYLICGPGPCGYADYQGNIGVSATPVIDRANGLLYVVDKDLTGTDAAPIFTNRMHVLDLVTGAEQAGSPFALSPVVPGSVDNGTNLLFDQQKQQARPGLLLLDGLVYVSFGSHGDEMPFHGFLAAYQYSASRGTLTQEYAWSTTQDRPAFATDELPAGEGSLWQSGSGPMVDGAGYIYVMVANGIATAQEGGTSYAHCFVKLSPQLEVKDWFLPYLWDELNGADLDTGSGGPILIPGTRYVVGAGKAGELFSLDTADMGHLSTFDIHAVDTLQIANPFFGTPLLWASGGVMRLYAWGTSDPLKSWAVGDGGWFNSLDPIVSDAGVNPGGADPVAILTLSTNGDAPGTSVLWANKPQFGDPNQNRQPGVLYAINPDTLQPLWNSGTTWSLDSGTTPLGTYGKFVPPVVANGKVYVPGSTSTTPLSMSPVPPLTGVEIQVFGLTTGG